MSQRYNDNIKRPKPQDTQLGILKTYAFCQKIRVQETALLGSCICLWEYTQKFVTTLLNGSRKGTVGAE